MGAGQSRQLRPTFPIANVLLAIPTSFVGLVGALANLKRDGTETDETEFMFELFEIYDKLNGTDLAKKFQKAVDDAKKQGKRQVDWTQLNQSMPGVKGKGYSATIVWVFDSLIANANKLEEVDMVRLYHLATKVVDWRNKEMKRYGGGDQGHQHVAKLWEQVKDLLWSFVQEKNWKSDL